MSLVIKRGHRLVFISTHEKTFSFPECRRLGGGGGKFPFARFVVLDLLSIFTCFTAPSSSSYAIIHLLMFVGSAIFLLRFLIANFLFNFLFRVFFLEIHGKCLLRDCGYARAIEVSAWWTPRIAIMKVGKVVTFYEPSRWSAEAEVSCATRAAVLASSTFNFRSLRIVYLTPKKSSAPGQVKKHKIFFTFYHKLTHESLQLI